MSKKVENRVWYRFGFFKYKRENGVRWYFQYLIGFGTGLVYKIFQGFVFGKISSNLNPTRFHS